MCRRALLLALHLGVGLGILLAVSAGTGTSSSSAFPTDPTALDYYDQLREFIPPSSIERTDVIEVDVGALQALHSPSLSSPEAVNESSAQTQTTQTDENGTSSSPSTIRLRHLAVFLTLRDDILAGAFDIAAGAILAAHHFNNGISDVVPQLADDQVQKSCQIRYTLEFFSTQFEPGRIQRLYLDEEDTQPLTTNVAADVLLNDLFRRTKPNSNPNQANYSVPDPTRPAPTGLLGPVFRTGRHIGRDGRHRPGPEFASDISAERNL